MMTTASSHSELPGAGSRLSSTSKLFRFTPAIALFAGLVACAPTAPPADSPPAQGDVRFGSQSDAQAGAGRLLITGGTVLTMDPDGTIIEAGAVAVDNGVIVAVGAAEDLARDYPDARRISADDKIVMPGLINTHTHVPMVLFRGLADDLELMRWLEDHIFPAEAAHVDEEFVRWGTRLACLEMLRGGITTFVDMYFFEEIIAEEADRCGMRAVVGESLIDFPTPDHATWDEAMSYTRDFLERWRDHPRVTPAVAPHSAYTVSTGHLIEAHALATEFDAPLMTHLVEDRAELERVGRATGRTSIDLLHDLGILDDRVLAAHVVWPSEREIGLLAESGVGVAHCPQSNMKIAAGVAPVPALRAAGVPVGLGTDGAASNNDLDLWQEIDTAAKLHKVTALDATVVSAEEALRMATVEGASAIDMEDRIGSLEVGKRADLIVVGTDGFHQQPNFNPYSLLTYSTRSSDVETVIIEGRVVVENGEVLTLDVQEVMDRAREYGKRIAASEETGSHG